MKSPSSKHQPMPITVAHGPNERPWIILIAILLLLGTLYIASSVFVPIVVSLLAYLTLRPVVVRLCKLGLNHTVAAAGIIIIFFSVVAVLSILLYQPLQAWIARAPQSVVRIKQNIDEAAQPLTVIDKAEKQLDKVSEEVGSDERPIEVSLEKPGIIDRAYLINTTGHVIAVVAAIAVLTFFMLASGDALLNRVLNVLPTSQQRNEVLTTIGEIQDNVGSYLMQITCINCGMGLVMAVVMWLLGMPTPILWGAMAALMNFIPFLGPVGGTLVVLFAASSVFGSLGRALSIAVGFYLVTAIEGQFVTPAILGKTLKVGSLVVLLAVAFWGFLWGIPGVLLAVPLLIVLRHIFSSFDATYPLAVVLGENPCGQEQDCIMLPEDQPITDLA